MKRNELHFVTSNVVAHKDLFISFGVLKNHAHFIIPF